jgi:ATP-dependent Clp protease ATP-binding subunit ClpB
MIFMNMQKLTKKSIEAIQAAQDTAMNYGNTNVDQPHLLYALLMQEDGLIPQLLKKMGKESQTVAGSVERIIGKIPKVSGSGRDMNTVYISQSLDRLLNASETIAKKYGRRICFR